MSLRLKTLREAHVLRQSDVADHLGVSTNYYAMLERGDRPLRQRTMELLCELYDVGLGDLFEDQTHPPQLTAAIELLKNKAGDGDLSKNIGTILALVVTLSAGEVAALMEYAQTLSGNKKG